RRYLPPVPPRRSSALFLIDRAFLGEPSRAEAASNESSRASRTRKNTLPKAAPAERKPGPVNLVDPSLSYLERLTEPGSTRDVFRSEEHTSELQSRETL